MSEQHAKVIIRALADRCAALEADNARPISQAEQAQPTGHVPGMAELRGSIIAAKRNYELLARHNEALIDELDKIRAWLALCPGTDKGKRFEKWFKLAYSHHERLKTRGYAKGREAREPCRECSGLGSVSNLLAGGAIQDANCGACGGTGVCQPGDKVTP